MNTGSVTFEAWVESSAVDTDFTAKLAVGFIRLSIRSRPRKLELRGFSDSREDRMNMHKNARLTPLGRERIVRRAGAGGRQRSRRRLPADSSQVG
jgi:hypothetical protein